MHGFRSGVERTQRFATHAFHEGRKTLSHIDRGLTTAAHIYHNVAPIVALLAVHTWATRGPRWRTTPSREKALQANRMVDVLHHATKKRTPGF